MDKVTRDHLNARNSRVNQFRVNDAYCDVEIQVEESIFKCHRLILAAASKYFHIMFGGKFEESTASRVTLKDVETNTFRDILQFIYTGDVSVNTANLYKLVRAGDFFKLPYLEESCVQYVQQNTDKLVENGLEIFSFTLAVGKTNVSEVIGRYIYNNFDYFSKTPEFLEISFEDFVAILNLISSSASTFQDVFMYAIMRWIRHTDRSTQVRRTQHFDELLKRINFAKLSSDCVEHLARMNSKYFTALSGYEANDETHQQPVLAINSEEVVCSERLHVYVNAYSEDKSQFVTNIFTLYPQSGDQQRWVHSYQCDRDNSVDFMRTTVLDGRLYCLSFSGDKLPAGSGQQTLKMSSSASLCSNSYLKPPPVILKRYDMYGFDKYIYICSTSALSDIVARQPANSSLSKEQLSRGIYRYNREIDTWESLTPVYQKFENACMIGDEQFIYLIGGTNSRQILRYDPRGSRWYQEWCNWELNDTPIGFEKAACCSHQRKIYVSGGNHDPHQTKMYDSVASKWHSMGRMNQGRSNHRIGPYLHSKGILVTAGEKLSPQSDVEFYDSCENQWKFMSSLYKSVKDSDLEFKKNLKVIDMINFKPIG